MNKQPAEGRSFLRQLAPVLFAAGLVLVIVLLTPRKESATMLPTATPAETTVETTTGIPPIDANAPTETKTATFAMG
ncbi:MAG: hypothetical protein PVG25_03510 [Anaerolineae bacterium]|jgi:hypothetical protein